MDNPPMSAARHAPVYKELAVARNPAASTALTFFKENILHYLREIPVSRRNRFMAASNIYAPHRSLWHIENSLRGKCILFASTLTAKAPKSGSASSNPVNFKSVVTIERVMTFYNVHCGLILAGIPQSRRIGIYQESLTPANGVLASRVPQFSEKIYTQI